MFVFLRCVALIGEEQRVQKFACTYRRHWPPASFPPPFIYLYSHTTNTQHTSILDTYRVNQAPLPLQDHHVQVDRPAEARGGDTERLEVERARLAEGRLEGLF